MKRWVLLLFALPGFLAACSSESDGDSSDVGADAADGSDDAEAPGDAGQTDFSCIVVQPSPYPDLPYVGVHGNATNNDWVPCVTADAYETAWEALPLRAIAQPNTFSPDGVVTYVTTANPESGGCTVFALDVETGAEQWCRPYIGAIASSVEVDEDGALYLPVQGAMVSLDADGEERWSTDLARSDGEEDIAVGLHFAGSGHIVTVTQSGRVLAMERADGSIVAELSLPDETGFEPPEAVTSGFDFEALVPPEVVADFENLFGESVGTDFLGGFLGASGNFSDNTISVGASDDLYIVGGGPDAENGSLMQVLWDGSELTLGWVLVTRGGSAASPSVSPDGRTLSVGDGAVGLTDGSPPVPRLLLVDIGACNDNTDADDDPDRCAASDAIDLDSTLQGSPPLLDDGEHYVWQSNTRDLEDQSNPDLIAYDGAAEMWSATFDGDTIWSSVITVTENHLIGTTTDLTFAGDAILFIPLPATAASFLTVVDRGSGDIVFRAPVPDDSTATVTVGPDGSLYVGMLGLVSLLAVDTETTAGLVRFRPVAQ